MFKPRDF